MRGGAVGSILGLVSIVVLPLEQAAAVDSTYVGGWGGLWSDPTSWSTNPVVPNNDALTGYDVEIDVPWGDANVDIDVTIDSLDLGSGLRVSRDLEVLGPLHWRAGDIYGEGNLVARGGLRIETPYDSIGVASLESFGDTVVTGPGFNIRTSCEFINRSSASFDLQEASIWQLGRILNEGLFQRTSATGSSTVMPSFENTGTVEVLGGALELRSVSGGGLFRVGAGATLTLAGQLDTTARIESPGTLQLNGLTHDGAVDLGGTLRVVGGSSQLNGPLLGLPSVVEIEGGWLSLASGDLEIPTLRTTHYSARFDVAGDLVVKDTLDWGGGIFSGAGTTTVRGVGSLTDSSTLDGRGLYTPNGLALNASMNLRNGATWHNPAGATVYLSPGSVGGEGEFRNDGAIIADGTVASSIRSSVFEHTGTVEVANGRFDVSASGVSTGSYEVASGAELGFGFSSGGLPLHELSPSSSIYGEGNVTFGASAGGPGREINASYDVTGGTRFHGGIITLAGPIGAVGDLAVTRGTARLLTAGLAPTSLELGGRLEVQGDMTVLGNTAWLYDVSLAGPGTTRFQGGLEITGTSSHTIDGRHVLLESDGLWQAGHIDLIENGVLEIAPGATLALDSTRFVQMRTPDQTGQLVNRGTFRHRESGFTSGLAVPVANQGLLEVPVGSLSITGGLGNDGVIDVAAGASLLILSGSVSPGAFVQSGSGTLRGGGDVTFSGATSIVGGIVDIGGTVDVFGTVRFEGSAQRLGAEMRMGSLSSWPRPRVGSVAIVADAATGELDVGGGDLLVAGSTLSVTGNATVFGGSIELQESVLALGGVLDATAARVAGEGTIQGDATIVGGVVPDPFLPLPPRPRSGVLSPGAELMLGLGDGGSDLGEFAIDGNLILEEGSVLAIELGGVTTGVEHDLVTVSGSATIGGILALSFLDGLEGQIEETGALVVVDAASTILGEFENAASGERLATVDGLGSFMVSYGLGSAFNPAALVLSNFQPIPEPSTALLIATGMLLLCVRHRLPLPERP